VCNDTYVAFGGGEPPLVGRVVDIFVVYLCMLRYCSEHRDSKWEKAEKRFS